MNAPAPEVAERPGRTSALATQLGLAAGFFGAYLFLDWLSYLHPLEPFRITPWNPQPAVAIALLLLYGQRWLPLVIVTSAAAELLLRVFPGAAWTNLAASLVLSLGYAAISYALAHVFPIRLRLDDHRDVLRLVFVVTAGTLLTGVLYVGTFLAGGIGTLERFPAAVLAFWIGDSVGILVTLPLLLMLATPERRAQFGAMLRRPETLAQAAATLLALWFVFGRHAEDHFKYFYLLFLPLVWTAGRSGMVGAALAAAAIQAGVMVGIYFTGHRALDVFELQGVLIALAIVGYFLGVTVDERERAAGDLRQSLRLAAAAEMAGALAHELNQPLAALTSYARAGQLLLKDPAVTPQRITETLDKVGGEARRAADVVRRLREFYRSGVKKTERVSLESIVDAVMRSLEPRAQAAGIAMRREGDAGLPEITADPLQIEVVLRNLLTNALEAVAGLPAERRHVTVELAREPRHLRVRVLDSGPGIPPEQSERLFEAFASTKATGMGLGLALSRAVIEAHGGRLWAVHGSGGELCFTLPLTGQP